MLTTNLLSLDRVFHVEYHPSRIVRQAHLTKAGHGTARPMPERGLVGPRPLFWSADAHERRRDHRARKAHDFRLAKRCVSLGDSERRSELAEVRAVLVQGQAKSSSRRQDRGRDVVRHVLDVGCLVALADAQPPFRKLVCDREGSTLWGQSSPNVNAPVVVDPNECAISVAKQRILDRIRAEMRDDEPAYVRSLIRFLTAMGKYCIADSFRPRLVHVAMNAPFPSRGKRLAIFHDSHGLVGGRRLGGSRSANGSPVADVLRCCLAHAAFMSVQR